MASGVHHPGSRPRRMGSSTRYAEAVATAMIATRRTRQERVPLQVGAGAATAPARGASTRGTCRRRCGPRSAAVATQHRDQTGCAGRLATQAMTPAVHRAATRNPPRNTHSEVCGDEQPTTTPCRRRRRRPSATRSAGRRERTGRAPQHAPDGEGGADQDRLGAGVAAVEGRAWCRPRRGSAPPSTTPMPPRRRRRWRRARAGDGAASLVVTGVVVAVDATTPTPSSARRGASGVGGA